MGYSPNWVRIRGHKMPKKCSLFFVCFSSPYTKSHVRYFYYLAFVVDRHILLHSFLWSVSFCWMDCVESFRLNVSRFPLSFTASKVYLTERGRKVPTSKIWKIFIFSSYFNAVFCEVFILMGYYWCTINTNLLFYFKKGPKFRNFAYLKGI